MTMFLVYTVIFAVSCGIEQGMTMVHPLDRYAYRVDEDEVQGVRSHIWFNWYHILVFGVRLSAIKVGDTLPAASLLFYIGAAVIWWSLFEAAYSYTRYFRFIPALENWLGTGKYIKGRALTIWIWARLIGGSVLLILGGLS